MRLSKKNLRKLKEVASAEAVELDLKTSTIAVAVEVDSTSAEVVGEAEVVEVVVTEAVDVSEEVAISTLMKTLETKIFSPKRRKNTSTWTILRESVKEIRLATYLRKLTTLILTIYFD